MVDGIRAAPQRSGTGAKRVPRPGARGDVSARPAQLRDHPRSARRDADRRDMITVKRPGFGIKPKHLDLVIGRTLRVDVEEDDILTWDMV